MPGAPPISRPPVETIEQKSERSVDALKDFVLTGNTAKKDEFLELWRDNQSTTRFLDEFKVQMQNRAPELKALWVAYKSRPGFAGSSVAPDEFALAVDDCYSELRKSVVVRDMVRIERDYGSDFVAEAQKLVKSSAVPSPIISDGPWYRAFRPSVDALVGAFKLPGIYVTAESKTEALSNAIQIAFSIKSKPESYVFMRAIVQLHHGLVDDAPEFLKWITGSEIQPSEKAAMAAKIIRASEVQERTAFQQLPHEILRKEFESYRDKIDSASASDIDRALSAFPESIRKTTLQKLYKSFEEEPSGAGIDAMASRLDYVKKKIAQLETGRPGIELQNLRNELTAFSKWLEDVGLKDASMENSLAALSTSFATLQLLYSSVDGAVSSSMPLVDFLSSLDSKNARLSKMARVQLVRLDKLSAGLLEGISVDDPSFNTKVTQRLNGILSKSAVDAARAEWTTDYFGFVLTPSGSAPVSGTVPIAKFNADDITLLQRVANLEPILATAFISYHQKAVNYGLFDSAKGDLNQRVMLVQTVARLHAISPLLVVKYFKSLENLANVCKDNPEIYRESFTHMTARLWAVADPAIPSLASASISPINVRGLVARLSNIFDDLSQLKESDAMRYGRVAFMDENIVRRDYPPYSVEQKPPYSASGLLASAPTSRIVQSVYPFAPYTVRPFVQVPFTGGVVSPVQSGPFGQQPFGQVTLPTFRPYQVSGAAAQHGEAMKAHLHPVHPSIALSDYLPGTTIAPISSTGLIWAIDRAFLDSKHLEYSGTILGGWAGGGLAGRKPADEWKLGGALVGSVLTPTGSAAVGASSTVDNQTFLGGTVVAVPVGRVFGDKELNIDSARYGQTVDANTKKRVLSAIAPIWDPKNPSELIVSMNSETQVAGDKSYMLAKYYYVDKAGSIFEVIAGQSDLLDALNFVAGSGNQTFGTPATYAWNYENRLNRGGGVLAIDIGKASILGHFQAIPYLSAQAGKPQPLMLQWTGGYSTSKESLGKKSTFSVTLPGRMLTIPPSISGSKERTYTIQNVSIVVRSVSDTGDKFELSPGAGYGVAPEGAMYRAGLFIKSEKADKRRRGGGISYEQGPVNFGALALVAQSKENEAYLANLHRLGLTVYGSKQEADRLLLGGLAHVVPQWSVQKSGGSTDFELFYRFIGYVIALDKLGKAESGARLDISRIAGADRILADYEQLGRDVGTDPSNAANLVKQFNTKYGNLMSQIFNNYLLDVKVNNDLSVSASFLSNSDKSLANPEAAYARVLYTWNNGPLGKAGHFRFFAALPVPGFATQFKGATNLGVMGVGIGTELLDSIWLQRMAIDVGLASVLATVEGKAKPPEWALVGGKFAQASLKLFSNVVDDSAQYRRLLEDYKRFGGAIRDQRFDILPQAVRDSISDGLKGQVDAGTLGLIQSGSDLSGSRLKLKQDQLELAQSSLWQNWFGIEKAKIQQKFDGHLRVYMGGSIYSFNFGTVDNTFWDIGSFVEYSDYIKAYLIGHKRDERGVSFGGSVDRGKWVVGAMGTVTESGKAGAAASVGRKFNISGVPARTDIVGSVETGAPNYTAPFLQPFVGPSDKNFGIMVLFSLWPSDQPVLSPRTN